MAEEKLNNLPLETHKNKMYEKLNDPESILKPPELLEILLYLAYPKTNTRIMAYNLLERFGTIDKVFSASEDALLSVKNITRPAATLIKLQNALIKRCEMRKISKSENIRLTPKNSGEYIANLFKGYSEEVMMLFLLDDKCRIKKQITLSRGSVDRVYVNVREIVKAAVDADSSYVIIAHNHPNGILTASDEDIDFTIETEQALSFVNIKLADHIIVAGNKYVNLIGGM